MPARRDVFRFNVRGAGTVARSFDRLQRSLQNDIIAELRELGIESTELFQKAAGEDTGQLAAHIRAVPYFRAVRPRMTITVDRLSGHEGAKITPYDYLGVTRRGHRKRRIYPKGARTALKVHIMGHRNPHLFIYRSSVSGVPAPEGSTWRGDWVSRAQPATDRLADEGQRRLGRRIERRLLR